AQRATELLHPASGKHKVTQPAAHGQIAGPPGTVVLLTIVPGFAVAHRTRAATARRPAEPTRTTAPRHRVFPLFGGVEPVHRVVQPLQRLAVPGDVAAALGLPALVHRGGEPTEGGRLGRP